MKISLLNPIVEIDPRISKDQMDIGENIGIGLLAAYLRKNNFEVQIVYGAGETDSVIQTVTKMNAFSPDIVGITIMSQTYPVFQKYSAAIRKNIKCKIVVGGILPSILQEKFLSEFDCDNEVDYLVYGDGEETLLELLTHLKYTQAKYNLYDIRGLVWRKGQSIIKNRPRSIIINLDKYPFPARDYAPKMLKVYDNNKKIIPALRIITSRGCYSKCLYCHINEYYDSMDRKVWRFRSSENIVSEIENLKEKYSVKHFLFSDDNFLGYGTKGIERAKDFAKLIKKKKIDITFCIQTRIDQLDLDTISELKDSGLVGIDVGIETINSNSLSFFNKNLSIKKILRNLNIIKNFQNLYLGIYMLNIHPLSSIEETYNNYRFLEAVGYFEVGDEDNEIYRKLIATRLEITKYTRMYNELKKLKLIGPPVKNNKVMYDFKFRNKKMDKFYKRILKYITNNGLFRFKEYFLNLIEQSR